MNQTLQALIESARGRFEGTAIVCENRRVGYAELDRVTDRIAAALARRGIGPGCFAGICMRRTERLIEAIWGVIKSGAAFVPIGAHTPTARVEAILEAVDPAIVIDEEIFNALLAEPAAEETLPARARLEDPGMVLFTSGSTGRPKGVCHSQSSTALLFEQFPDQLTAAGIVPAPFDAVIARLQTEYVVSCHYEYPPALLNGRTLVLLTESEQDSPPALCRAMNAHPRFALSMIPSQLTVCMENADFIKALSGAACVLCYAEPIGEGLRAKLEAALSPEASLITLYGQTEVFGIGWQDVRRDPPGMALSPWVSVMLSGDGEICVHSPTMFTGYLLGDVEANAAQFDVKNTLIDGTRCVRTGDVGRLDENGRLRLSGRLDRMVKLHGQRVELAEIEQQLLKVDGVVKASAVLRGKDRTKQTLVAFYEQAPGVNLSPDDLRRNLLDHLPAFMVPAALIPLEAIPTNANGKLDYPRLTRMAEELGGQAEAPVGDDRRTPEEALVIACAADVLNLPEADISPSMSLIALGMDSLSALGLIGLLDERGYALTIHTFLSAGSIRELAAELQRRVAVPTAPEKRVSAVCPVTDLQDYWIRNPYRVFTAFTANIALTEAEFKRRVERLTDRHPALRSAFFADGEAWRTRVLARKDAAWEYHDLRGRSTDPRAVLRAAIGRLSGALSPDALLFAGAWRIGESETAFLLGSDHRAVDGMSEKLLIADLLSSEPVGARDGYIDWLEAIQSPEALDAAEDFWRDYLSGAAPAFLPPAQRGGSSSVRALSIELNAAQTARLVSRCKAEGVTLPAMVVYQYGAALSALTGEPDLCFYAGGSGRSMPMKGLDRTVGCLTQIIPVRWRWGMSPKAFMEGYLDADRYSYLPARRIFRAAMNLPAPPPLAPFINSLIFPKVGAQDWTPLFDVDYRRIPVGNFLWLDGGALNLAFHFDAGLWNAAFAEALVRTLEGNLNVEG